MLKKIFWKLVVLSLLFIIVKPLWSDTVINRIIAVVNGEIITSYDLDREIKTFYLYSQQEGRVPDRVDPEFFLQKLIDEILLKEEADRLKISVSDIEVEKRIELIKERQRLNDKQFRDLLKKNHMSLDEFKEKIRTSIKITRLLKLMVYDKVMVTPQEVKKYYEAHKSLYNLPKRVRLKIIVMKDSDSLYKLRKRIQNKEISFERAASLYSIGPGASQGGDLGVLKWTDLRKEFKNNLKGLKEGEISKVFELGGQWIVLKVEKIFPAKHRSLEEVKDEIKQRLYEKKTELMMQKFITGLRKKAVMEIKI